MDVVVEGRFAIVEDDGGDGKDVGEDDEEYCVEGKFWNVPKIWENTGFCSILFNGLSWLVCSLFRIYKWEYINKVLINI